MIQLTTDRARHSRKTNDNMRVPHDRGAITTRGPTQNKPVTWQTEWRTRSKTRQRAMHIRKLAIRQKENRVAGICNAVSVRSEADSNRCTRFCRPLPSHSAIRPNRRSFILRNIPDREYLETPDTPANPPCRQLRTIRSVLRLQIYKHFSFLQNLSGNFRFSLKNPYLYVEFHPSFSCLDKARIRSALRPA